MGISLPCRKAVVAIVAAIILFHTVNCRAARVLTAWTGRELENSLTTGDPLVPDVVASDHVDEQRLRLPLSHRSIGQLWPNRRLAQSTDDLVDDFHDAAEDGDLEEVKRLIRLIDDVDIVDKRGDTALILAASEGRVEVMRFLLEAGADINWQGQLGGTAIWTAVLVDEVEAVKFLAEAEADLEIRSDEGSTPLYVASSNGNFPAVTVLLKAGADVEAVFHKSGTTPLMAAALSGSTTVVAALLAHGPDLDARSPFGYSALHFGAISGSVDVVKTLLDAGADIDARAWGNGDTVIILAAEFSDVEMIRTLIEHGANVRDMNRWGRTALHTASLLPNNSAVLELLLNKGLDVNIKASAGETALAEAAWIGNKGNVAFLLSKGANPDIGDRVICGCLDTEDQSQSPVCPAGNCATDEDIKEIKALLGIPDAPPQTLLDAVKAADLDAVETFIREGVDIEAADADGNNPLIIAAARGLEDITLVLLDAGANINHRNMYEESALHVAAFFGHAAVMRILIRLGNSAVDIRDMSGFTPLHNAAERGYLTAVQHLLDAGASVDVQSFAFKFTPIFLVSAAEPTTTSHLDVLRELIDFGGDVTINGDGEVTPLHGAAKVFGTASIMKILIEEGVDVNSKTINGTTPIQIAAYHGNRRAVEFLLSNGADISIGSSDLQKVCGCLDDTNDDGTNKCPLGACEREEEMEMIREQMGQDDSATQAPPESAPQILLETTTDCSSLSDLIAQLECVAAGERIKTQFPQ